MFQRILLSSFFLYSILYGGTTSTFDLDRDAILSQAGCYEVHYKYEEKEVLDKNYKLDSRVYDVKAIEYIHVMEKSENEIRLQHVLIQKDTSGKLTLIMKHTGDDWVYEPSWIFDFKATGYWEPKDITDKNIWVRKINHLDDGLRYQCAAAWDHTGEQSQWTCDNAFAPIPGRESRDMKRKDYNTMERNTTLVAYKTWWEERQSNKKVLLDAQGNKNILVREEGGHTYTKIDEKECATAKTLVEARLPFWEMLRDIWANDYMSVKAPWKEKASIMFIPRFMHINTMNFLDNPPAGSIEDDYYGKVATDPTAKEAAIKEIKTVIENYRE